MKKAINLCLLIFISISCYSQNKKADSNVLYSNFPFKNTTFFSYKSVCNIKIEFLLNNNLFLNINGKESKGKLIKSKYDEGYYDVIVDKNRRILSFKRDDDLRIIVENQKYQFGCESAKEIELKKVDDSKETLQEVKEYIRDYDGIVDITLFNDKAYYLEQMKCYKTSVYILEQILKKYPDRVVAYLNLGDAYWGNKNIEEAKKAYQKYILLMKSQRKDLKKIPQRVYDRIK
jgi:tetratricopeptide (TPR) repeat protein